MTQAKPAPAFDAVPSIKRMSATSVEVVGKPSKHITAVGVAVASDRPPPALLELSKAALDAAGFDASIGSTLKIPREGGPLIVAVGVGTADALSPAGLRDASAAFARAAATHSRLAITLPAFEKGVPSATATAQALVEGILLARYRYDVLRRESKPMVQALELVAPEDAERAAKQGAQRGKLFASATHVARDLANTPHSHLNAARFADLAQALAGDQRLSVEVYGKKQLREMGCGGLLGVNAGSTEPPRMVVLRYQPDKQAKGPRLAMIGKGVMYDSGGLSLKPGDEVHAQMKNDMAGAAAVYAAMSVLAEADCTSAVTAYLMCTDNMPSGTAMALGDVITIRGGTTVEVINTDAEGRLIMADALVLACEEGAEALIDVATLTGACIRALGSQTAGLLGNHKGLLKQVRKAARTSGEAVWTLPLDRRYRRELDSNVADLRNLGREDAGAITAALFLSEFVGDTPWAHLDIAGTAQSRGDEGTETPGCTGFGARLLLQLALGLERLDR